MTLNPGRNLNRYEFTATQICQLLAHSSIIQSWDMQVVEGNCTRTRSEGTVF